MLKKFGIFLGILVSIIIIAAIIIANLDFNRFKPMISETVKNSTGLDMVVNGDIKVSFIPLGLTVNDVSLANQDGFDKNPIIKIATVDAGLDLKSLLFGNVAVNHLLFDQLDVNLIKSKAGKFNFTVDPKKIGKKSDKPAETAKTDESNLPPINIVSLKLNNLNIKYVDLQSGAKADVTDLNINIKNVALVQAKSILEGLSLQGFIKAKKIAFEKYHADDIKGNFSLANMSAKLYNLEYLLFDSKAQASLSFNLNSEAFKLSQKVASLDLNAVSRVLAEKELFKGKANLDTNISFIGTNPTNIKKTLTGNFLLTANDVHLKGYDLDAIIAQSASLEDLAQGGGIGALIAMIPEGTGLSSKTKSKVDRKLTKLSGGTTIIKQTNIQVPINKGTAQLQDVAFSTGTHLVALKGNLLLAAEKFDHLKLAVLNRNGCIKFSQTIDGSFNQPKIKLDEGTVSTVVNIVGSLFSKAKETTDMIQDVICSKPFYQGKVAFPN